MKTVNNEKEQIKKEEELLKEYQSQVKSTGKHDYHVDGYYSDYSDDSCCC